MNEKFGDKCEPVTPPDGKQEVSIEFDILGGRADNGFLQNIAQVNAYIFDHSGICVLCESLDSKSLGNFRGLKTRLFPDKYTLICWANINERTRITGIGEGRMFNSDAYVSYADHTPSAIDKVYYAPGDKVTRSHDLNYAFAFEVNNGADYSGKTAFTTAHRIINIYVENYTAKGALTIALRNVPDRLSFAGMEIMYYSPDYSFSRDVEQSAHPVTKEQTTYMAAEFTIFRFDNDNDIEIVLIDTDNDDTIYAVSLDDARDASGSEQTDITLSMILSFTDTGVDISLPGWSNTDVDPDVGPLL
jgi:hypothetical protein